MGPREPKQAEEVADGVVKSADRALDVIELLASWGRRLTHTEIALSLEIPKSSLTKLLKNLTAREYLHFDPRNKDYGLGGAILKLAQQLVQVKNLVTYAQPLLEELTQQSQESSALNQLKGDQVEIVATVNSKQRLISHLQLGDLAPLYAVSGGKAMLAFLPDSMRAEYLQTVQFTRFTPKTVASRSALSGQIEQVRRTGVSLSDQEYTPGIVGIGVPILSAAGFPLGSLNFAIPAVRFSAAVEKQATAALKAAAERLRRRFLSP